jgi:hypothetical protein
MSDASRQRPFSLLVHVNGGWTPSRAPLARLRAPVWERSCVCRLMRPRALRTASSASSGCRILTNGKVAAWIRTINKMVGQAFAQATRRQEERGQLRPVARSALRPMLCRGARSNVRGGRFGHFCVVCRRSVAGRRQQAAVRRPGSMLRREGRLLSFRNGSYLYGSVLQQFLRRT